MVVKYDHRSLVEPASNEFSLEGKFGETVLLAKRLLIDENFVPTF